MQAPPPAQMRSALFPVFSGQPLIGRFVGTRLRVRKRIWYANPGQTYLSAELIAEGGETRIRCRFSLSRLVVMFHILWFSGVVLAGGFAFVDALHQDVARAWRSCAVPTMLMLVLGSALVGFERFLARNEQRFLTDFVQQTLNARRIESP